jgi:hypothetical protein
MHKGVAEACGPMCIVCLAVLLPGDVHALFGSCVFMGLWGSQTPTQPYEGKPDHIARVAVKQAGAAIMWFTALFSSGLPPVGSSVQSMHVKTILPWGILDS